MFCNDTALYSLDFMKLIYGTILDIFLILFIMLCNDTALYVSLKLIYNMILGQY